MSDKVRYEDLFDADLFARIQEFEKAELQAWETHKKWTLDAAKSGVVTKDTAETLKKLEDALKRIEQLEDKSTQSKQKLIDAEKKLTVVYQMGVQEQQARMQTIKQEAQLETISADSLKAKQIQLERLQKAYTLASAEMAKGMIPNIQKLDTEVKKLEADMGRNQRNVGNYKSGYNGLGNSINQLSREMPAFANSVQTGFMALSNNIPIFADQISMLREENKRLNAEGIKTPSVFKSITAALFSWQTAMSFGVTILTVYGKEIVQWISKLLKSNIEVDKQIRLQNEFNNATKEGLKNAQDEVAKLNILYSASQDQTRTLNERKLAVDELQKQYPKYFENLSDEAILSGRATRAYDLQRQAIIDVAMAQAYKNKISENAKKIVDIEDEIEKENKLLKIQKERTDRMNSAAEAQTNINEQIKIYSAIVQNKGLEAATESKIKSLNSEKTILEETIKGYTKRIKIDSLISDGKTKSAKKDNEELKRQKILLKENLEMSNELRGGVGAGTQTISTPIPDMSQFGETRKATLFELLYINDEQKSLIKTQMKDIYSYMEEAFKKEEELSKKRTDLAKDEVKTKQDNLREQQSLQSQGYSANVLAAEKELEAAKKAQKKAEEEQRKAALRTIALQTVEQTGNLITGSTKIISSFAAQPWIMYPLLAAMWGTFAASKIKAVKATKETYGDGGTDVFDGGTHTSGNDTYFSSKNGKRRYAERGERWAIFNRKATSAYGGLLPELINSANKLSLQNILETKGGTIINMNTTRLENGMDKIVKNTSEKVYTINGRTVIKRGNITENYV